VIAGGISLLMRLSSRLWIAERSAGFYRLRPASVEGAQGLGYRSSGVHRGRRERTVTV
jgi:hypothetical protein